MEVHQHTHTPRNKWTHYFWEFIMLFLAVFCGFLAEYQLEHTIEKSREKQYIKSFAEDLAMDTTDLEDRIRFCDRTSNSADSLIEILTSKNKNEAAGEIYYFFRFIHRSQPFTVNDRTIVQLRNAGGMRLIKNKNVTDSMLNYYKAVDFIRFLYEEQIELKRSLRPLFNKFLNGIDYGKVTDNENRVVRSKEVLKLKPVDEESINTFILTLQNIKGINMGIKMRLSGLKAQAMRIRGFIFREYHLK